MSLYFETSLHLYKCFLFSINCQEPFHNAEAKIYWDLNWMDQSDPKLINFIKNEILIPPPASEKNLNLNINMSETETQPWLIQGQNGEAFLVDQLYKMEDVESKKRKGKINDILRHTCRRIHIYIFHIQNI